MKGDNCKLCNKILTIKKGLVCYTCKNKKHIQKNPLKYAYRNLKYSARRRNIIFGISFEYFCEFVKTNTNYIPGYNRRFKTHLGFDRIINKLGYTEGNLQIIKQDANSYKYQTTGE